MIKSPLPLCLIAVPMLLVACNNDDSFSNATPGGLYDGTLTSSASQQQDQAYAIVDETGYGRMIDFDSGDYYQLALTNNGQSLNGTYQEYPATTGESIQPGTFKGSLNDQGLSASLSVDNSKVAALSMLFDFNYFNGSNLNLLSGNWSYTATDGSYGISFGINASGALTGSDTDGCTYAGNFTLFDVDFDAYHLAYTETCDGTTADYTGLAAYYYADTQFPAGILMLADDGAGSFLAVQVLSSPAGAAQPAPAAKGATRRPMPALQHRPLSG
jgi:hypothetical protein